jgi:hypothetical protein
VDDQVRRLLGLYGFFYGCVHLLTYVWFNKFFGFGLIGEDIVKRPYITVGMASFVMLIPLALTSTQKSIKRLGGKRWNLIHRLVYVAAIGGVIHYYMLVKADTREPILFSVVVAVLLSYPLVNKFPQLTQRTPRAQRVNRLMPRSNGCSFPDLRTHNQTNEFVTTKNLGSALTHMIILVSICIPLPATQATPRTNRARQAPVQPSSITIPF